MERRVLTACNLRMADVGGKPRIVGYAAVFGQWSDMIGGKSYGFRERIRPGAFRKSLESGEGKDMRAFVDHDSAKILGRRSAGTLTVSEDSHGLKVEIDPPDTSYSRDVQESIRRGDINGMSFGFTTVEDVWTENRETGETTRELVEVEVFEASVVTFPAYPQTEVALRSLERWRDYRRKARLWLAGNI